ncbi:alpha-L RNA-binding motif-containing protein [Artomyces pyxidatus]|uniref:Alpha-L RNA-binding motif-containing protein n=1 Tax=Artomyces pyxidatus TaxID=48021 RepID=A0ACB8TFC0_9AGAM|nr:alpha-L RNA-binding motif-containing protein [Artomyces pyxidatus]
MRDANVYSHVRALPRMSWSRHNLFNLWKRSLGELAKETNFSRTTKTLFQQRWAAKQLVRAYHGDFINEKTFKRWYLPSTLPDVRPRHPNRETVELNKWARQVKWVEREKKERREEIDGEEEALAPVGSLMFAEIERRIDVVIFRACLAHSVYEARRMVIHGDVLLNGKKHQNSNTRLAPGDMVSVDPKAISFLQPKPEKPAKSSDKEATESKDSSESDEQATLSDAEEGVEPSSKKNNTSASDKAEAWCKGKGSDLTPFNLPPYASPFLFIPAYIEPSFATCSAIYVRHPTARPGYSEIPTPYDADGEIVRLAWEWYAKVRPRNRSKRQLARMPENRQ